MNARHFIVATAGHVDHGKSALVQALTGTNPDRLPEEKARGITIDLGFAHLELAEPSGAVLELGMIDVPGHEDLIKNMVSGLGAIDLALLVVAADDGWMPQTEEHLQILEYLGVARAVVALTKADLVLNETDLNTSIAQVREHLRGTGLAEAPIVPTSVVTGLGLAALRTTLCQRLADSPPPADMGKPRLAIDRAFSLRGIGTIVTGTLQGGSFTRGQTVVIQPGRGPAHIRAMQSHNRERAEVVPGSRVALNLPELQVVERSAGPDLQGQVRRGQVVTVEDLGTASTAWDVVLRRSARLAGTASAPVRPMRDGARVWIHHGSDSQPAQLLLLQVKEIGPAQSDLAQVRFEKPAFAFRGDRFIVRDWAQQATLAGGIVLDPDPAQSGLRDSARTANLERCAAAPQNVRLALLAELTKERIALAPQLLRPSLFSQAEVEAACAQLEAEGQAVRHGDRIASVEYWSSVLKAAEAAISDHHRRFPEQAGLPLSQFRSHLAPHLIGPDALPDVIADLAGRGLRQVGSYLQRTGHQPALPPALQTAGAQLRQVLTSKGIDPPSRKEIAPDQIRQQALRFLIQSGEAIEIGAEVVLAIESYTRAVTTIRNQLARGPATVSELRQSIGASRRIAIPLLEKLDREGMTRREGDHRALRIEKLA